MYLFLALVFSTITLIVNVMAAKMVPFWNIAFTAGLFFYPLTFFINDLVIELYGVKQARQMILLSFLMSVISFIVIKICLWMPAVDPEIQKVFEKTFSLNGLAIFSGLTAFALSQLLDSSIYQKLKKDNRPIWVRNQGSLIVSQFVDSFIVHTFFFYLGQGWSWEATFAIISYSFIYKTLFALTLLPLFVGIVKSRLAEES